MDLFPEPKKWMRYIGGDPDEVFMELMYCSFERHPLADELPMQDDETFDELVKSIEKDGFDKSQGLIRCLLSEGGKYTVVDGRHRLKALIKLNWTKPLTELERILLDHIEVISESEVPAAIGRNIRVGERKVSDNVRAWIGARLTSTETIADASEQSEASMDAIKRAKYIMAHGVESLHDAVLCDEIDIWTAYRFCQLTDKSEQAELVESARIKETVKSRTTALKKFGLEKRGECRRDPGWQINAAIAWTCQRENLNSEAYYWIASTCFDSDQNFLRALARFSPIWLFKPISSGTGYAEYRPDVDNTTPLVEIPKWTKQLIDDRAVPREVVPSDYQGDGVNDYDNFVREKYVSLGDAGFLGWAIEQGAEPDALRKRCKLAEFAPLLKTKLTPDQKYQHASLAASQLTDDQRIKLIIEIIGAAGKEFFKRLSEVVTVAVGKCNKTQLAALLKEMHWQRRPEKKANPYQAMFDAVQPYSSEEFKSTWNKWCQHLISKRVKLTLLAVEGCMSELASMGEVEAIKAIEYSISKNWSSIHREKTSYQNVKQERASNAMKGAKEMKFYD